MECVDTENKPCSSLPYPCISCYMNDSCVYGNQTIAKCKANVACVVCKSDIRVKCFTYTYYIALSMFFISRATFGLLKT